MKVPLVNENTIVVVCGSLRKTHWIFGGIERGSNKIFAVPVPNRKRRTRWPIIFKYIAPGTHNI
jgi:hypothetical protein